LKSGSSLKSTLYLANNSKVAVFYILQIGKEEIMFLDLDQNADHPKIFRVFV